jgi:hypothetical protein
VARIIFRQLTCVLMVLAVALPASAQTDGTTKTAGGPRRQIALIIFAGLGGAILGLSTLSFYGRPQDRLSNIAVGFALGVIGGTVYVTYKAAAEPKDFYGLGDEALLMNKRQAMLQPPLDPVLNYRWTF